jgi:hypothetical protein
MADQKLSLPCARPKTELLGKSSPAKRAAIYTRVSCGDQHPKTQVYDLRELVEIKDLVDEHSWPFVDTVFVLTKWDRFRQTPYRETSRHRKTV